MISSNAVLIVDPAISNSSPEYKPYGDGLEMDIFIKVSVILARADKVYR
jgi:hypothetical protein